jgi:hypothetical protein
MFGQILAEVRMQSQVSDSPGSHAAMRDGLPPIPAFPFDAPYSETGRLGPHDLKRWTKSEKPIEIIE